MTTKNDELKPCPFCGCANIHITPDEVGSGGQWVGPVHVMCGGDCVAGQSGDDRKSAIAAWNRRAALQSQNNISKLVKRLREADKPLMQQNTFSEVRALLREAAEALQHSCRETSQDREGWKEAAIAWEVCASLHREYCKGKDPFYKNRQADFVKHAEASREKALSPCSTEDKTDAERYRWLRNSAGFLALPYEDHGLGPEFPTGSELDAAIDHARRAEEEENKRS